MSDRPPDTVSVLDALDDPVALGRAIRALPSIGALLPILTSAVPPGVRLEASAHGDIAPRHAVRLGRVGLWLASQVLCDRLPSLRTAPSALHERWDAVVEMERARPEAPWLVGAVLAEMSDVQERLARRTLIGVERRFGRLGWEAIEWAVRGRAVEHVVGAAHRTPGASGTHG